MRLFKYLLSLCLYLPFTAYAGGGKYPLVEVEMELIKLSPHCYYVQGAPGTATDNNGFVSNAGVIIGEAGVVVIDSLGSPSLGALLLEKIRAVTDKPIVKAITTHYHADHILGLQVFKEQGAEIIAPRGAMNYVESPYAKERLEERRFSLSPWVDENTYLVTPDKIINAQEKIQLGEITLSLSFLGGAHSDGDLAVLVEPDLVLYSGDVIFEGRVPFVGDADTAQWLKVLTNMQTAGLNGLVPGHGPANEKANESIKLTRDYLAFLREHMGAAVENFMPFNEAYSGVDWTPFAKLPAFEAANRRNAYQVYLSIEAETVGR